MRSRRRYSLFAAAALSLLVVGLAWPLAKPGFAGTGAGRAFGLEAWRDPVLVFVLGSREQVAGVRAVVDSSRVVAESPDAFAVRERRLVAATAAAVGPLLESAGWRDAQLEILAVSWSALPRREEEPPQRGVDDTRLAELVNKPTLTLWEARLMLESML